MEGTVDAVLMKRHETQIIIKLFTVIHLVHLSLNHLEIRDLMQ